MVKYIIKLLAVAFALLVAEQLVKGIEIDSFWPSAVLAAFIFGLLNATARPLLQLFALPVTLLTFGVFSLIINIFTFWLITLVPGVTITGFIPALLGLLIVTTISWMIDVIIK